MLKAVINEETERAQILDFMTQTFEAILGGAKRQLTGELKRSGIGGFGSQPDIKYYCTVCSQYFDIPEEKKEQILNSEEILTLPSHHDQEMQIKIENVEPIPDKPKEIFIDEDDFSVSSLLNKGPGFIAE